MARGGGRSVTHLSMESLLSLREPGTEPGAAAAREHVNQCPQCQAELDRLHQRVARLKALAPLRPSRDRWPETAARFRAERRQRRHPAGRSRGPRRRAGRSGGRCRRRA